MPWAWAVSTATYLSPCRAFASCSLPRPVPQAGQLGQGRRRALCPQRRALCGGGRGRRGGHLAPRCAQQARSTHMPVARPAGLPARQSLHTCRPRSLCLRGVALHRKPVCLLLWRASLLTSDCPAALPLRCSPARPPARPVIHIRGPHVAVLIAMTCRLADGDGHGCAEWWHQVGACALSIPFQEARPCGMPSRLAGKVLLAARSAQPNFPSC